MADTEQVSSTTPNEEPKVEATQGMGDVALPAPDNEAEAKVVGKEVSDIAVEHNETPMEPPITEPSPPPSVPEIPLETAPQAPAAEPVTSTTEDATEQLTKEAVTEEAAPTAPAHTEETAVEKTTENITEPVPVPEEPVVTTPKVEENHMPEVTEPVVVPEPEVEAPAPVAAPVVVPEPEVEVEAPAPVEEPVVVLEPKVEAPAPVAAPVVEEPVVVSAPPEPAPVVVEEPVIVAEEPPKVAAPVEEPIVVEPPKVEEPIPVPEPAEVPAPVEEAAPVVAPSYEPAPPAPAPPASVSPLMQLSEEHWSSSLLVSQDSSKVLMDSDTKDMTSGRSSYDHDLLGGSDDDLPYEMQKSPFQGINLGDGMSSGFSHFEDEPVGGRLAQMSESPTPDLVQYAQDGELLDSSPFQNLEKVYNPVPVVPPEPTMQPFSSSLQFSTAAAEEEEPGLPPVLPDILKSSPLNPDKVDSGSSEGSPDLSPVHRRGTESPNIPMSLSANNPFAFDTKISLLAEMAEETEARAAAKAMMDDEVKVTEQSFGAFDLVKEAKDTQDVEPPQDDVKNWNPSSQGPDKVADKFECLNFPKRKRDASDSESPSADSLSPVLEAMAKNPSSFQVESDKVIPKDKEIVEAAEEASEQEASSEEFEFVERPPRGAIDEFLETLDSTKFSKTSELPMDEEPSSLFKLEDHMPAISSTSKETAANQSSYLLLTEPSGKSSPQRSKAGLELSDVQESLFQAPVSQTYAGPAKKTAERTSVKMPNLNVGAVVDLLYWRDVKASGVVFGANLLLLLSLTVCSIISVLSYVALGLLSIAITFRIYKGILQAIQKSDEGHPFKLYLDKEVALSEDMVHKYSDIVLGRINSIVVELRRLFLVEDLVDSLKFAVCMWILTYIGALFNGLTLLILGLMAAFSCPIVYEKHQTQIDQYLAMVNNQIKDIVGKVQAKVPGLKKKAE